MALSSATTASTPTHLPSKRGALGRSLTLGAITGQLSGLLMAVVVMAVFTLFLGKGPLFPVQVIGSILFGDVALQGFHLPAFLSGLLLHQLGPALMWGLVFGGAVHLLGVRRGSGLLALGVAVGLLSQLVDVHLVLPAAFEALHGHNIWAEQVPAFWSWAAHLVFGLGLGLYPHVAERFSRR
jgi:hypothetical protein